MAKPKKLNDSEISAALEATPEWELLDGRLHRELVFESFVQAFGFMTSVALLAEAQDHHPNWSNVYRRVTIDLYTHEVDGITARDFALATAIDALL